MNPANLVRGGDTITLQELKNSLDILEVALRYTNLKKINSNTYLAEANFLREERTSSLFLYRDSQRAYDFGTGENFDVLDLICRTENKTLQDLLDTSPSIKPMRNHIEERLSTSLIHKTLVPPEQLEREFNSFERINLSDDEHLREVREVIPHWLLNEANSADADFFLSCIRYDKQNRTMVVGWYDNTPFDLMMVSYKRRRLNGAKWINRKSTHPNGTIFHRVYDDKKPIYVVEGARDSLTSILLGLNFIAIPTANYRNAEPIKNITRGSEVVFVCEDATGYKAMKTLAEDTPNNRLLSFTIDPTQKIDLSDYVMSRNSIKEVIL